MFRRSFEPFSQPVAKYRLMPFTTAFETKFEATATVTIDGLQLVRLDMNDFGAMGSRAPAH